MTKSMQTIILTELLRRIEGERGREVAVENRDIRRGSVYILGLGRQANTPVVELRFIFDCDQAMFFTRRESDPTRFDTIARLNYSPAGRIDEMTGVECATVNQLLHRVIEYAFPKGGGVT